MKKKVTQKKATSTKTPKISGARRRAVQRINLRGLVEEARGHLDKLATLFACTDAELDAGEITGSPPERREQFNYAIAGIVADLDAIRDDHCGEAVMS